MQGGSSIFDQDLGEDDGHMLFSLQGGPHGSAHVKDEQVQRFAYPGAHHPPTQTDLRMCSGGAGVAGGLDPTAAGVHNTPAGYFGSPSPLYGFGQSNGFAHPVAQHPSTHHDLHYGGAGVAGGLDPTAAGVRNTPAGYFGSPPPLHGFGQPNGFGALNYPTGDMVAMHAAMQEVQRNHAMQRRTAMQMATQMPTAPQSCHAIPMRHSVCHRCQCTYKQGLVCHSPQDLSGRHSCRRRSCRCPRHWMGRHRTGRFRTRRL